MIKGPADGWRAEGAPQLPSIRHHLRSPWSFIACLIALLLLSACEGPQTKILRTPMVHDYGEDAIGENRCERRVPPQGEKDQFGGWKFQDGGSRYLVKVPVNYEESRMHPLLVVFSPAGASAEDNERFTRLTPVATEKGFVVAYIASRPMSLASVKAQAKVIGTLMAGWCIDPKQVFFAGHSDGGTVSTILALLPESRGVASGIAVSAAGVLPLDTQPMGCPSKPLKVLLMHAEDDTHFPGYGRKMAQWWSQCFRCTGVEAKPDAKGCRNYIGCESSELKFCEGSGGHIKWPAMQSEMLNFFLSKQLDNPRGQ